MQFRSRSVCSTDHATGGEHLTVSRGEISYMYDHHLSEICMVKLHFTIYIYTKELNPHRLNRTDPCFNIIGHFDEYPGHTQS